MGGAGGHRAVNFTAPRALEPDSALARQLRALLLEHGVLVFPGQAHLLPDDEVRIAQLFDHDATEEHPSRVKRAILSIRFLLLYHSLFRGNF